MSGVIDIGAYEAQSLALVVDTLVDESDGDYSLGDLSLREAVELANANPESDTIRFDPSLYGGTTLLTMGELAITDSLSINGAGAELLTVDASGNDPTPDSTYQDGDDTNDGDGSRVFNVDDGTFATNIDVEIVGVTLTGGDVDGSGGAILSLESLTLADATITQNFASHGGGVWAQRITISGSTISGNSGELGGGIYIGAVAEISDSTISGNSAGRGGGILSGRMNTTIIASTISGNSAIGTGGGILARGVTTITHSSVTDNSAIRGGGIFDGGHNSTVTISHSTISGNSAESSGGGIFASGTTITHSTISHNSTEGHGGGIWVADGATITHSTISGNSALGGGGGGGGPYIWSSGLNGTTIIDSTISGNNSTGAGGGIFARVNTTIIASTISGNTAGTNGGGIQASDGTTISHSTIAGNVAYGGGPGEPAGGGVWGNPALDHTIVAGNTRSLTVRDDLYGSVATAYSLIGDGTGATITDNGGPTHTHALRPGSPAIDAGDPSFLPPPLTDQRGFYRVIDGDGDMTARIDIGAYEFASVAPIAGDGNLDGVVDMLDYLVWADRYGDDPALDPPGSPANGDYNGDGVVDGLDYLVWGANFGATAVAPVAQQLLAQHQAVVQNAAHDAVLQEHDDSIVTPQLVSSVTDAGKTDNTRRLSRAFDQVFAVFAKLAAKKRDD